MTDYVLVPRSNPEGVLANAVELPNWLPGTDRTVEEGNYVVYELLDDDFLVDQPITSAMLGLGE